ncbi:unnamed protein product [Somion occarium]|uniref:MYND-type domain-containing protein n=1 Tax=Somion occarium TaxID=3059160 RepID=A0ABP1D7P3_9APHY
MQNHNPAHSSSSVHTGRRSTITSDSTFISVEHDPSSGISIHDYIILRNNQPHKVVDLLRALHSQSSASVYGLMACIIGDICCRPNGPWEAYLASGLPSTMMDMALDDRVFRLLKSEKLAQDYLSQILSGLATYSYKMHDWSQQNQNANYFLENIPVLLGKLWVYRTSLFNPVRANKIEEPRDTTSTCACHLIQLLHNYMDGYVDHYGRFPTVDECHLGQLLLLTWIYCDAPAEGKAGFNRLAILLEQAENSGDLNAGKRLMEKTLDPQSYSHGLQDRIRLTLMNEEFLNEQLLNSFSLIVNVLFHWPPTATILQDQSQGFNLISCIAAACQRQICMGLSDPTYFIIRGGFSSIGFLLRGLQTPGAQYPEREVKALMRSVNQLQLLAISSKFHAQAIAADDQAFISSIFGILFTYTASGIMPWRVDSDLIASLRSQIGRILAPTLESLRALPISLARVRAIKLWTDLAKAHDIRSDVQPDEAEDVVAGQLVWSRRCHWRDCVCSHTPKPNHRVHVCKGCWRTYYCGIRCQKRDWSDGGHKTTCRRMRNR